LPTDGTGKSGILTARLKYRESSSPKWAGSLDRKLNRGRQVETASETFPIGLRVRSCRHHKFIGNIITNIVLSNIDGAIQAEMPQ
jgi:hypothetical protein